MKHLGATCVILAVLAGCSTLEYRDANYGDIAVQQHQYNAMTYRIRDNREEERLFIALGFLSSAPEAVLGMPNVGGPEPVYRAAALDYLRSTGADCDIVDGTPLFDAEYEFFYAC